MTSVRRTAVQRMASREHPRRRSSRRIGAALWFPLLLGHLSCGGGGGAPIIPPTGPVIPPTGPAPQPPVVPTPPLPPEIGTPCPGVVVRGDPPTQRNSIARTTLLIDWEQQSGGRFDWAGPYYNEYPRFNSAVLEVNVAEWRVDVIDGATRHTLEIEWPAFLPANLVFRSDARTCELPTLVCRTTGCTLNAS